ncbi:MAG: hypothetical protein LBJ78_00415 [Puniceicoccales bacterium]|jgi:hypothetical protein|nr:hypothetical protein [Puniceicoccales bacterium]
MPLSPLNPVYPYPLPVLRNPITGAPMAPSTDLSEIRDAYKTLFKDQYTPIANNLLRELSFIVTTTATTTGSRTTLPFAMDDTLAVTMPSASAWPTTGLGDAVSKEGNRAYMYYLKDVVNDLRFFCGYVEAAGDTLQELSALNGNANDQAHVLLDKLQCYDQLCRETVKEFSEHFKYNFSSDTWEEVYDAINPTTYAVNPQVKDPTTTTPIPYATLTNLREMRVACTDPTGVNTKPINTFNELSKLDKLKYIKWYYNLILKTSNPQPQTVFPDDLQTGYPCLPDKVSTSGTEDTKALGALELFYIGYLISRDGPINALSSFFEIKTQALRQNISLMMGNIEAMNQFLTFLNRGLDLLNSSQAEKEKAHRIPDAAALALRFFCEGTLRGLKELTIGNKKEHYLVLSCNEKRTDDGYSVTKSGNYLLVKADMTGLDSFLGTKILKNDEWPVHDGDKKDHPHIFYDGTAGNSGGTTSDGFLYVTERIIRGENTDRLKLEESYKLPGQHGCDIYRQFEYANSSYSGDNANKPEVLGETVFVEGENVRVNERVVYHPTSTNDILLAQFTDPDGPDVKSWLPKAIKVDSVLFGSVLHGDDGRWFLKDEATNTTVSSWTTAFTNKTQYINTAIESINNEVAIMRTKIDTFDSAATTFRNNASDTYKNILSRIG